MLMLNHLFVFLLLGASLLAGCAGIGTPIQPKS
jgi:hypothetical protein